ncbi:MAG: S41 family peptidase [Chitinophagaceae bacterium]|nr:S41 family peptidase [Chitinophagaceae bacterium]
MEPTKPTDFWQPFSFALVLIVGMLIGVKLANQNGSTTISANAGAQLDQLVRLLSEKYVDTLDEKKLYESGIEGILSNLDPHTVYIPAKDLVRSNAELEGSFYGIGIEFYMLHDTVIVSGVIPDGPSDHTPIHPGDKIIRINDSVIAGRTMDEDEIIRRIRGEEKSTVTLTLQRLDNTDTTIHISRGMVPIKSVTASFKLTAETGYIKIDLFSETTYDEFKEALDVLVKDHIKKLIIDVRENPGGYMDAVARVADELIAGTHTIVRTKGKNKSDSLMTSTEGLFEQGKLCILVDENSASASEILAGAIQDLDRGTVIGRRTYGKGLVQEQFELPDHAAIRITTARYYLPSGRCIQRSFANGKDQYRHDIIDRFSTNATAREDSMHKKATKYYTLQHRMVYGEEGVTPDLIIPLDTTYSDQLNDYYIEHMSEQFAQHYYYFHRPEFKTYTSLEKFSATFTINGPMLAAMNAYLRLHHVSTAVLSNKTLVAEINTSVRAQFARLLFGNNGKYKELLVSDKFVQKALMSMN